MSDLSDVKQIVGKGYRASVTVLIAVGCLFFLTVEGYMRLDDWVGARAQAATTSQFAAIESGHRTISESITDHEEQLKAHSAALSVQHDLLLHMADDVKFLRADVERRRK